MAITLSAAVLQVLLTALNDPCFEMQGSLPSVPKSRLRACRIASEKAHKGLAGFSGKFTS